MEAERPHAGQELYEVGSMLSYDERLLLHWAARAGNPSADAVVDAGCFLGGSTVALGLGVLARPADIPRPALHVYDLFVFGDESEQHWVPDSFDFSVGGSTVRVFDHNVRAVRELLTVHRGDVRRERWSDGPIGVLFIDIAKSWETGDVVWREFFPALDATRALVIQQDLVHWGHPWCAIAMELLDAQFDFLGWVSYSSAVYRCVRPVVPGDLPGSLLRDVSLDQALTLLDRAAARIGEPMGATVRLSGAVVMAGHSRFTQARARVEEIRSSCSDDEVPYISEGIAHLDAWIDGVASGEIEVR